MAAGAMAVQRGCGRRKAGGAYAELGLAAGGMPLEDFLMDPPWPVEGLPNVSAVGITLYERDGVTHILDWVGSQHYLNVADFVEEVRRYGLSRRLPESTPFERITPESRLLTIHARARIENAKEYRPVLEDAKHPCPKRNPLHEDGGDPVCIGLCWQDVEGGEGPEATRAVKRKMPSFTYTALRRPEGVEPEYRAAVFASWPLSRIAVVKDPLGNRHEALRQKARRSPLEVAEVDE